MDVTPPSANDLLEMVRELGHSRMLGEPLDEALQEERRLSAMGTMAPPSPRSTTMTSVTGSELS